MQELLPGWITSKEAQELTGYNADHLRRLARKGRVIARKVGESWVYNRDSLLEHKTSAHPGRPGKQTTA